VAGLTHHILNALTTCTCILNLIYISNTHGHSASAKLNLQSPASVKQ